MKECLSVCLLLLPLLAVAQLKYDANWVFGKGCGIDFNDPSNPRVYHTAADNFEPNASISDADGILQLYAAHSGQFSLDASIYDADNQLILNGSGIFIAYSATNGAVFVPLGNSLDSILLIHIGEFSQNCGYPRCYKLYSSLVVMNGAGEWEVAWKNRLVFDKVVVESFALVRKSDGRAWWLLIHDQTNGNDTARMYHVLSVTDEIAYSDSFDLGHRIGFASFIGEVLYDSRSGSLFDVVADDNVLYVSRFDRCTGSIYLGDAIEFNLPYDYIYSLSMSDNYIYISTYHNNIVSNASNIYYCKMYLDSITNPVLFHTENINDFEFGQLERGPDGNIWVSYRYEGRDTALQRKYQKHMSIIKDPGSDTARFVPEYLFMGDSASVYWGLPSFPNYNLGPEGVFRASAGRDTVLCTNSGSTGAAIGSPPVPNIIYSWQPATGLSATDIAQPIANPAQSTWYYLTATDTTATSCAVNIDSVYVKVETCVGIDEVAGLQAKIYPNPTNGQLTVELLGTGSGTITFFNLLGQHVYNALLNPRETTLSFDLPQGVYIYRIGQDGKHLNGKLVVE